MTPALRVAYGLAASSQHSNAADVAGSWCELRGDATWEHWAGEEEKEEDESAQINSGQDGRQERAGADAGTRVAAAAAVATAAGDRLDYDVAISSLPWPQQLSLRELYSKAHTPPPRPSILKRRGGRQQDSAPRWESDSERTLVNGGESARENSQRGPRQNCSPSKSARVSLSHTLSQVSVSPAQYSAAAPSPSTLHASRDVFTPRAFAATAKSADGCDVDPASCESHVPAGLAPVDGRGRAVGANSRTSIVESAVDSEAQGFSGSFASMLLGSEGKSKLQISHSSEALTNSRLEAYAYAAPPEGVRWVQGGVEVWGSEEVEEDRSRERGESEEGESQYMELGSGEVGAEVVTDVQQGLHAAREAHQKLWRTAQRWQQGPFPRYGWPHIV